MWTIDARSSRVKVTTFCRVKFKQQAIEGGDDCATEVSTVRTVNRGLQMVFWDRFMCGQEVSKRVWRVESQDR